MRPWVLVIVVAGAILFPGMVSAAPPQPTDVGEASVTSTGYSERCPQPRVFLNITPEYGLMELDGADTRATATSYWWQMTGVDSTGRNRLKGGGGNPTPSREQFNVPADWRNVKLEMEVSRHCGSKTTVVWTLRLTHKTPRVGAKI